jgi:hypothetical protein
MWRMICVQLCLSFVDKTLFMDYFGFPQSSSMFLVGIAQMNFNL